MNAYLGIDLGGTKIAAGLFNKEKKLLCSFKVPTYNSPCPNCFAKELIEDIEKLMAKACVNKLMGIGIGVPGVVQNGVVLNAPNIKCLKGFSLGNVLEEHFSCKVIMGNDANVAALAQFDQNDEIKNNMVYITVSSGIGGGIILNGKIFEGDFGSAAEIGHMLTGREGYSCACGNSGCFESMASGTHLTERVLSYASKGRKSPLCEKALNGEKISGFDVKVAFDKGDKLAEEIIEGTGELVGELCYNIFMVLNIGSYCIGGGLTAWGEPLFRSIKEGFEKRNKFSAGTVNFYKATDSDDAGIFGAVNLIWS